MFYVIIITRPEKMFLSHSVVTQTDIQTHRHTHTKQRETERQSVNFMYINLAELFGVGGKGLLYFSRWPAVLQEVGEGAC